MSGATPRTAQCPRFGRLARILAGSLLLSTAACDDEPVLEAETRTSDAAATESAQFARDANTQIARLHDLHAAFHAAIDAGDAAAMAALFAPDAVAYLGGQTFVGRGNIEAAFAANPAVQAGMISLTNAYTTEFELHGNAAQFAFECLLFLPDALADGTLAGDAVVAHANATGIAKKVGGQWLFYEYTGGTGAL